MPQNRHCKNFGNANSSWFVAQQLKGFLVFTIWRAIFDQKLTIFLSCPTPFVDPFILII